MTTRYGHYYEVRSLDDSYGLATIFGNEDYDKVVEGIIYEENRAKEGGYDNDAKWLIILVEWEKAYDNRGVFENEIIRRRAISLYDNGTAENL